MAKKEKKLHKGRSFEKRQTSRGYAFMLPWIIGFIVFTLAPFIATIYLSFMKVDTNVNGYDITPVGFSNYYSAIFKSTEFVPAIVSFVLMAVPYTFVIIVVAFIMAYLLNKIKVGKGIMRTIYFLPVIIMSGPVMSQILDDADEAIKAAQGVEKSTDVFILQVLSQYSPVLSNFLEGMFDQLTMILWFTGIPIVLFISALQKINPSLYEAAKIDMANEWQILWKITIPMVKPTALVATVFIIVQLGTYDSSAIYNLIITATGNTDGGLGFAATFSWLYCIVVLLIIGIAFLLFRDREREVRG